MQHISKCAVRIGPGPRVRGETMLGETQTGWAALRRHSWRKQRRITRGQEGGGKCFEQDGEAADGEKQLGRHSYDLKTRRTNLC